MCSVEWWHFQRPWRTPNPVFNVTACLNSNISCCGDKVTIAGHASVHGFVVIAPSYWLAYPISPGDRPTLSLTTNSSWLSWGGLPCLSSALWCQYPMGTKLLWTLIGNHIHSMEFYHFQWPWVSSNSDFKVVIFVDNEYLWNDTR